jgi:hypothetical protein
LIDLGRVSIPKNEYFQVAQEKAQLSESEAQELLNHFHASGTFCNFENSPSLKDQVILKPQEILHNIYANVNPSDIQQQIQSLSSNLVQLHEQITPLLKQKVLLDKKANKALNSRVWLGLGYLSAQTAFFAKLTWIDYGWDVVEPMTYFVTFTTGLIGYIYFTFRKRDYSYEHAMTHWLDRRKGVEYSKEGFPLEKLRELQLEYDRTVQKLLQLHVNSYGEVEGPKRFQQTMETVKQQETENEKSTAK